MNHKWHGSVKTYIHAAFIEWNIYLFDGLRADGQLLFSSIVMLHLTGRPIEIRNSGYQSRLSIALLQNTLMISFTTKTTCAIFNHHFFEFFSTVYNK